MSLNLTSLIQQHIILKEFIENDLKKIQQRVELSFPNLANMLGVKNEKMCKKNVKSV
jgi:hypothetical protein